MLDKARFSGVDEWIASADRALYRGKREGRKGLVRSNPQDAGADLAKHWLRVVIGFVAAQTGGIARQPQ